mgnify:CR=1 FL=1
MVFAEIGVVDEQGDLLPPGQLGEFACRRPHVMAGYCNDPESSRAAFKHGWLHGGGLRRGAPRSATGRALRYILRQRLREHYGKGE